MDDGLETLSPVNILMSVLYTFPSLHPSTHPPLHPPANACVSPKGPFDLHGAVALRQAPAGLHDVAAALPVLPAAGAGAPLLRADLPPPQATQVTPPLLSSIS